MSSHFREIAWQETPIGILSLRRRMDPIFNVEVDEIKLDDEFLMSSLFTVAEIAVARLGLAALERGELDVLVGGLGLGYTARTVLEDPRVRSMVVIEALNEVIDWHRQELLPLGKGLVADSRCQLVNGDFFAVARGEFDAVPTISARQFDAIVVDIDHSPRNLLHASHAEFYTSHGIRDVSARLRPGGVFALWSDDPPDEEFVAVMAAVFASVQAHVVEFDNAYTGGTSSNTVYVGSV